MRLYSRCWPGLQLSEGFWRILFQGGSYSRVVSWLWLLEEGCHSSPQWLLHTTESSYNIVHGFPKASDLSEAEAAWSFMTQLLKSRSTTFAVFRWVHSPVHHGGAHSAPTPLWGSLCTRASRVVWLRRQDTLGAHGGRLPVCHSCPWHRLVTVVGVSHLLASVMLGSAESSFLFC